MGSAHLLIAAAYTLGFGAAAVSLALGSGMPPAVAGLLAVIGIAVSGLAHVSVVLAGAIVALRTAEAQATELAIRFEALETATAVQAKGLSARVGIIEEKLKAERQMLSGLMQRLTEKLAEPPPPPPPQWQPPDRQPTEASEAVAAREAPEPPWLPGAIAESELSELAREAMESNATALAIDPIMRLPSRKLAYLLAESALVTGQGEVVRAEALTSLARLDDLDPLLANFLLYRSLQMIRTRLDLFADTLVFCPLSAASVQDQDFMPQFLDYLDVAGEIASSVVFSVDQAFADRVSRLEALQIDRIAERGFRFALTGVARLDIDALLLRQRHIRFVCVDAELLLERPIEAHAAIAPTDLAKLLDRYGITLIVTGVKEESDVLTLGDLHVGYAGGRALGVPWVVRDEPDDASRDEGRLTA